MALPDPLKQAAVPLAKLKQYFDRIHLKYSERRCGNATIIQVQPKGEKDTPDLAPHRDEPEIRKF